MLICAHVKNKRCEYLYIRQRSAQAVLNIAQIILELHGSIYLQMNSKVKLNTASAAGCKD